MIDRDRVNEWLVAYVEAWKSYDPEQIGALFSADAEYRYHPYDEPIKGREAIVTGWIEDQDVAGTYDATYRTIAVDGAVAVATGTSVYRISPTDETVHRVYENCFVLEFDDEMRCRDFTEWFVKRP